MAIELRLRKDPWIGGEPINVLSWLVTSTIDAVGYESRHIVFERLVRPEDLVTMRLSGDLQLITDLKPFCIIDNENQMHEFYQNGKVTLRRQIDEGFIFEYDQHTHTKAERKIKEPG